MWRAVSRRPAFIPFFAEGCRVPRRPLHLSLPRPQIYQPREPGFYARLRFRKDGTPRSKLMGAFLGLSLLLNVFLLGSLVELIEVEEETHARLPNIVHLLRVDNDYEDVDLDDAMATMAYFKRMAYAAIPEAESDDKIESLFYILLSNLRSQGEKDPVGRVHEVLRPSVERIHQVLEEPDFKNFSYLHRLNAVLEIFQEAFQTISDMVNVDEDEEDSVPKPSLDYDGDDSKQDPETTAKDYESLG